MIDNKTPHLGLPLPDLGNQQDEDVPRIGAALVKLDAHAAENDASMAGTAETLERTASRVVALEESALDLLGNMNSLIGRMVKVEAKSPDLAGPSKAGIVKIGQGIAVENDGTISVTPVNIATMEKVGTVKPGIGLVVDDSGALNISYWDAFPPYVPIPVWGVTFGGSDGRRAIMPGEANAREDWVVCDGGSDDKGGTLPNLKGRVFLGADASRNAGTLGGSASHSHTVTGSVDAATISTAQMPSHGHAYTSTNNQNSMGVRGEATYINNGSFGATTGAQGGNTGHTHSLSATGSATASYMPYCAINFVMKVA